MLNFLEEYENEDMVYSPCYGRVTAVEPSFQGIKIRSDCGIEMLVYVDKNNAESNRDGLEILVKVNEKVKEGTPLFRINRTFMKEKSINLTKGLII